MTYGTDPYGNIGDGPPPPYDPAAFPPNMLLLSPVDSDEGVITASSEISTLPASNLQNVQPRRVWRSTGTDEHLSIALASAVPCNAVALVGSNLDDYAWVRLRGAATDAEVLTDPVVDTGWVSPWQAAAKPTIRRWPSHTNLVRFDNDTALRYWRLDIVDDGGGLAYIEAGRLVLGRVWQPTMNFDFGGTPIGHDPRDAVAESDYGSTFTDRRTSSPPRLFNVKITANSASEVLDGLQEIQRLAGLAGDVICCLDPLDTARFHLMTMQGRFRAGGLFDGPPYFDGAEQCWGATISLREFL